MTTDLIIRPAKDLPTRLAPLGIVLVALITAFLGVRWQIGDMVGSLTSPADPQAAEMADTAIALAPMNAVASNLRASIGPDARSADTRTAVQMAEETVRLSPLDYRWRISLARALALDEQYDRAEVEAKRAIELAPQNASCRWYYGNFLLRQDRAAEAIEQFRMAAVDHPVYRRQVFSLLWDYSKKDASLVESVAGRDADSQADLAYFYASHGLAKEAVWTWSALTEEQKASRLYLARIMAQGLFEQKRYPEALQFSHEIGGDAEAKPETVTNASFERSIEPQPDSRFGWNVTRGDAKLDIALDSKVKHEGGRSLRLTFKGESKPEFSNIAQTVAVEPNTRYRLTFWVRTENLRSAAGPQLDVMNGNEFQSLGRTAPLPNGTNDWQQFVIDFTTPENCSGIQLRTIRASCSGDECPITGILWYDEFVLSRL